MTRKYVHKNHEILQLTLCYIALKLWILLRPACDMVLFVVGQCCT